MTQKRSKTIHEAFARFFEAPTRESLRTLLWEHVGELRNCDFKEDWPDNALLAKHILGLGNAGGGCLVLGVKENGDKTTSPVGVPSIKDKADVSNAVKPFLPEPLLSALEIADFKYEASEYPALIGKLFQVVFVHDRPESLPYVANRAGTKIRSGAIYVRREGQTEEATYEEVQKLIDRRLTASPQTAEARDLKEHLEELKVLYSEIPQYLNMPGGLFAPISQDLERVARILSGNNAPNPRYPDEDYQSFVRRLLDGKKALVEVLTGVRKET